MVLGDDGIEVGDELAEVRGIGGSFIELEQIAKGIEVLGRGVRWTKEGGGEGMEDGLHLPFDRRLVDPGAAKFYSFDAEFGGGELKGVFGEAEFFEMQFDDANWFGFGEEVFEFGAELGDAGTAMVGGEA